jgi:hypothetical protein
MVMGNSSSVALTTSTGPLSLGIVGLGGKRRQKKMRVLCHKGQGEELPGLGDGPSGCPLAATVFLSLSFWGYVSICGGDERWEKRQPLSVLALAFFFFFFFPLGD